MCFAAEDDDLSKKEAEPATTPNDNNSHATPPKSPTPTDLSPPTTPTKPAATVPELNGTTPDRKPSPEPKTTTPEPASENINNGKSNNKHVEELYDIPVGK